MNRARQLAARVFVKAARLAKADAVAPSLLDRECPICGYSGPFLPRHQPNVRCPQCRSHPRHRLLKLRLDTRGPSSLGETLHFAPEPVLASIIKSRSTSYRSSDLEGKGADLRLNIESIELPSESVDTVICFHILEHLDDRAALAEVFRILRSGGVALLAVPIVEGWDSTYENPAVQSERDRTVHFLQHDHVRLYGRDFRERVKQPGFRLEEFTVTGPDVALCTQPRRARFPGLEARRAFRWLQDTDCG